MGYKHLLLVALLMPRLEMLAIPGVNSDIRLDVILILATSLLPIFRKFSIWLLCLVLAILLLACIQFLLFEPQPVRMVSGILLYISIILFSQYSKILTFDDLVYICRWFLLINGGLHLFDMVNFAGVNHNFTGRFGVFNQHFAFAAAILISYFFLHYHNRRDRLVDIIFWSAFLLSGSRGLIVGVLVGFLITNFNFIKHFKIYLSIALAVPIIGVIIVYLAPENIHVQRFVLILELAAMLSSDASKGLADPAFNVRLSNIFNYIDYLSVIDNSWVYVITGGGPYNFLDYSVQYGQPGHFDNLYFRLVSEFGLIGLFAFVTVILYSIGRNSKWYGFLVALLIGGIVSEALVTLKVGHLFFLILLFTRKSNANTPQYS